MSARRLAVFLCHSSESKPIVRQIHDEIASWGYDPWLDEYKLTGGQNWEMEIRQAVRASDVVLVCLTGAIITKTGYIQREIRLALDAADERPEGTIFLIPVRLEECVVPDRLRSLQRVDYFAKNGCEQLRRSLRKVAVALGLEPSSPFDDTRLSLLEVLRANQEWSGQLAAASISPRLRDRMAQYTDEKIHIASSFGRILLRRCKELTFSGHDVFLFIDSGTTV